MQMKILTYLLKRTLLYHANQRICTFTSIANMHAIKQNEYGEAETMYMAEEKIPAPGSNQILVEVYGTAVNRADLLMRKGSYPGQQKVTPGILGLEMSGIVKAIGHSSTKWKIGDRVMGLLPSNGYAEYCVINEDHVMPVHEELSLREAGGLPEVWLTAYQLLHLVGSVKAGDVVLIHGGGSGVGTAAVQLVKLAGAISIVTAGTADKIATAVRLGANAGFNYKEGEFVEGVMSESKGNGINLILDCVGGSFWKQNMACLAKEGTWVNYGLLGGGNVDGNLLGQLIAKRATLTATTLKARSDEYKGHLITEFARNALPFFMKPATVNGAQVKLQMIVDKEFPLESVVEAHKHVGQNKNIGKVLLKVREEPCVK